MDLTSRTMLVVESDAGRRMRLAEYLSKHHVSVLLAGDLGAAQSIVKQHRVAAVVLDAQAEHHGNLRERLCMHGLDVDTPFLVLDESSSSAPFEVELEEIVTSTTASTGTVGTMQAGSQTSLLYALPHEYRTPLTDIIGQSAFLHGHATSMTSDEIRESSTDILKSARRLLRITDNFLLFAQLETLGESPYHVQRMRQWSTPCAGSVINEAIRERATARGREHDISCSNMCQGISARIMPQYLTAIVGELVDNACAFSITGSPIHIAMEWDDTALRITVADAGIGMTDEECRSVGPYKQFRRSELEQQGVGLGLTIAQRLVELHGGALGLSSIPHVGTTVSVNIPRVEAHMLSGSMVPNGLASSFVAACA